MGKDSWIMLMKFNGITSLFQRIPDFIQKFFWIPNQRKQFNQNFTRDSKTMNTPNTFPSSIANHIGIRIREKYCKLILSESSKIIKITVKRTTKSPTNEFFQRRS
jgi:hypothetical protein